MPLKGLHAFFQNWDSFTHQAHKTQRVIKCPAYLNIHAKVFASPVISRSPWLGGLLMYSLPFDGGPNWVCSVAFLRTSNFVRFVCANQRRWSCAQLVGPSSRPCCAFFPLATHRSMILYVSERFFDVKPCYYLHESIYGQARHPCHQTTPQALAFFLPFFSLTTLQVHRSRQVYNTPSSIKSTACCWPT